jgi:hypothetical protein
MLHLWRMCCLPWWHDPYILVMRDSFKIVQIHCHQRKPLLYILFLNHKYPQVNFWFYPVISLVPLWEIHQLKYVDQYWELQIILYLFDKKYSDTQYCNVEVCSLNVNWLIYDHGLPQSFQAKRVLGLSHDCFLLDLSNSFFTYHLTRHLANEKCAHAWIAEIIATQ